MERVDVNRSEPGGYVAFWAAGDVAKGEFHCSDCGYGVTVHRVLPQCPMCGGTAWEQAAWSPFTRAFARDERPQ
jgi:rubredoxin